MVRVCEERTGEERRERDKLSAAVCLSDRVSSRLVERLDACTHPPGHVN